MCVFCVLDDEEALNSIMKDLAALGRCYTQHHKPKSRTLLYKQVHAFVHPSGPQGVKCKYITFFFFLLFVCLFVFLHWQFAGC